MTRLGFVQADPIRAPARAQDLTLRHRVKGYRAGDLEARYEELPVEEDHFLNYGFLPRELVDLMHPRAARPWDRTSRARATKVLAFVREAGEAHPRDVDARFAHGTVTNYWGGTSSATTHLLEAMHFRGMLEVVRREAGIRVYAPRESVALELDPRARAERLLDVAIGKYAPLPAASLRQLASRLRHAAPQLAGELRAAAVRALASYPHVSLAGVDWYWLPGEDPARAPDDDDDRVRLLAPFDPVVWDRRRFELFWGWAYRFEAYTPAPKRKLGYYALPLLFRDQVIGWANVSADAVTTGFTSGKAPRDRAFARGLEAEIAALRAFLRPR